MEPPFQAQKQERRRGNPQKQVIVDLHRRRFTAEERKLVHPAGKVTLFFRNMHKELFDLRLAFMLIWVSV